MPVGKIRVTYTTQSCGPHDSVILQSSVDGTNLDCSSIRVIDTNSYCRKTIDSRHYTAELCGRYFFSATQLSRVERSNQ